MSLDSAKSVLISGALVPPLNFHDRQTEVIKLKYKVIDGAAENILV